MNRLQLEKVEASLVIAAAVLGYGFILAVAGFVVWLFWS